MKVLKLALIFIIIITAVLIGTPIQYNCMPVNIGIMFIGILFIIYLHFIKKRKIFTSKLDIAAFILCISPLITIISNTYISLNDSIVYFMKYISCFIIYLLSKHLVQDDSKNVDIIINVIVLCSCILCVIGIDNMTTRWFSEFLERLKLPYIINLEGRMFSSMGYANSFAIILGTSIILILDKIINKKTNKAKLIYSGALFLNLSCLILTYSRTVIILLVIAILMYIFINYNKSKCIITVYTLLINGILSLLYVMLWNKLRGQETYIVLWIMTLALVIISGLLTKIFSKIYKRIEKISLKTYVTIIIIFFILVILAIILGLKLVTPLSIFQINGSSNKVKYKISDIKPNTYYSFKFDIDAKSTLNYIDNYSIRIEEENKYYDMVERHEITFNNYNGIKEINFTTSDETIEVAIIFESKNKIVQQGVTVNSLKINDEEHPLKYLYLPVNLVDKIKSINLTNKSVWERGTFYKDAIKIIKDNFVFGIGGNGWIYKYIEVQSYNYSATEVHSYLLQVFMDYGIVGLIALISILVITIVKILENKKTNYLPIGIAFFLLIFHSFVDFDMSFFFIMLIAFVLLGIISSDDKKETDFKMSRNLITSLILIIIFIIGLVLGLKNMNYSQKISICKYEIQNLLINKNYNEAIETLKKYRNTEKYLLYSYELENIDYEFVNEENINYIYNVIEKMPITINAQCNIQKNKIIEQILNKCNNIEIKNKFAQLIINQNDETILSINNKEKNRLSDNEIESYLKIQNSIYSLAKSSINYKD